MTRGLFLKFLGAIGLGALALSFGKAKASSAKTVYSKSEIASSEKRMSMVSKAFGRSNSDGGSY